MQEYNLQGWVWSRLGVKTKLLPLTLRDNDAELSAHFTEDFTEILTIGGATYKNPGGGLYELSFTDSDGNRHTEDFLAWSAGHDFIFARLPGSNFDSGSKVTCLGDWTSYREGLNYDGVTCFAKGTLIQTVNGFENIEAIKLGDIIKTKSGLSPVLWIGQRKINEKEMVRNPKLRPIRISSGSLGNGLPKRDLLVSRQHRMLIESKISERMFQHPEVLISAIKLISIPGVFIDKYVTEVEYFHMLFDKHRIIFAEGSPTESMYTGAEALKSLSEESREEILTIFPAVAELDYVPTPARFIPNGKQQKKLAARHLRNNQPCQRSPI